MYRGDNNFPIGVKYLIIATAGMYVLQILPTIGNIVLNVGALMPSRVLKNGEIWRLFTYIFLHDTGSPFHIFFNMFGLWMFGSTIENQWGTKRFVIFYLLCGAGAAIISLSLVFFNNPFIIGASGALLGILTVYAYYYPDNQIILFIFPVPARMAVIIIGLISILGAARSTGGIAHLTHLGGIVVAIAYLRYYNVFMQLLWRYQRKKTVVKQRREQDKQVSMERFEEDVIDPILRKINKEGMDSLTGKEKETLKKFSEQKKRES